jgi:hypothetical protein
MLMAMLGVLASSFLWCLHLCHDGSTVGAASFKARFSRPLQQAAQAGTQLAM